jgi:catechol-2,3-dioxygenase
MSESKASSGRRPGILGVHSVDHFALEVPDLAVARTFYETFGLDVRDEDGGLGLYSAGNPHRWGKVTKGAKKRLVYLSLGVFEDDLPRFREKLQKLNLLSDPPAGVPKGESLWLKDPNGIPVALRVQKKSMPDEKTIREMRSSPGGVAGGMSRSKAAIVRPTRMSHIAMFSTDVLGSVKFYEDTFGLRLSDRSLDLVAFMHGPHGSDHHMVAFVKSNGPGLHHVSWDVNSLNDVGVGAAQMAAKGYDFGWGTGRHVLGSNYFHYVRDPWGSYCEYSYDIDYIPATMDWPAADHDPADSLYLWGPNVPPEFMQNTEAA